MIETIFERKPGTNDADAKKRYEEEMKRAIAELKKRSGGDKK